MSCNFLREKLIEKDVVSETFVTQFCKTAADVISSSHYLAGIYYNAGIGDIILWLSPYEKAWRYLIDVTEELAIGF